MTFRPFHFDIVITLIIIIYDLIEMWLASMIYNDHYKQWEKKMCTGYYIDAVVYHVSLLYHGDAVL